MLSEPQAWPAGQAPLTQAASCTSNRSGASVSVGAKVGSVSR